MKRKFNYLLILPLLALFASCSRDVFDEYYGRPDYLEDPIYQQLDARGNFKNFTALIEKAGYKDILSKSGYWTIFAPDDSAFTEYFQENGISNVSQIDDATAAGIVRYALVYNAFSEETLPDYQGAKGWEEDNAFRRRTAFYDGFLTKTINGESKVIVGSNRNGSTYFVSGDTNNKYITYFADKYFAAKNLSSFDFNYFYPNADYTGLNVFDSKVTEADIVAENGMIHIVDKVNAPLPNIDQYLESNSNYSLFRSVIENNLVSYVFNQDATDTYHNYTGNSDNVYVKVYDPTLVYALNNENYLKQTDNDGQSDAYTFFAPNNVVFQNFINTVLLKNYESLDKLPNFVFQDLINAHMVSNAVWPSKFASYNNALNESIRFDKSSDIEVAKVLSNGFFYGTNKVQKSNLFYSVYTSAYLDPKFALVTRLFNDGSGYKEMISNINQRFTIFLPSDTVLRSLGYDWDGNHSYWTYTSPSNGAISTGSDARSRLLRVLYNSIVATPNDELNDLSGSGIIRTGDELLPGEYIKWNNNTVYAAGNEYLGNVVNIVGHEDQENGRTYYVDNVLEYSTEPLGFTIQRLSQLSNSPFLSFYNYLKSSSIYSTSTGKIQGVDLGTYYTVLIPSNAAITAAIAAGDLPSSPTPGTQGEVDKISDFIRYHILATKTISDDGQVTGIIETLRKDTNGDKTYVTVKTNSAGFLTFTDEANRDVNFVASQSRNLADRSLIHLVDNYLKFEE